MKLCESRPVDVLAPFVKCLWYVESSKEETSERPDAILPNGTSNLIFNLSAHPHREFEDERCVRFCELKTRWLSGIQNTRIVVGPSVRTHVIGIRFRAGGLLPFVPIGPSELVGLTVHPDDLWGSSATELHEQLWDAATLGCRFRLLQDWLMSKLHVPSSHNPLQQSLQMLAERDGNIAMEQLAARADLSLRQFRRRFERAVGLSPKRLSRILRFSKLIRCIDPENVNWSALAVDCGYYDQSHLIADFREFASTTPREYVSRRPVVPGFLPVPMPVSLFSNTVEPAPDTIAISR